jgi:hypothetical protein
MDLDPYQPCPGGLDKKIKFCCKDLVRELDEVSRKLEANQPEAARVMVDQLQAKHGDRECLCAIGCSLSLRLDDLDTAEAKIRKFREIAPHNPIGLALAAMTVAGKQPTADESDEIDPVALKQHSREAMDLLQQALAACGQQVPVQVYEAIGIVAHRVLAEGQTLAARELFTLQAVMAGEGANEPLSRIMEIGNSAASGLLKQDLVLPEPPAGPGKDEYLAAVENAQRGAWAAAAQQIAPLAEKYPDEPVFVQALARLHLRMAHNEEAITLLRRFASMAGVDQDDAVESEALAQLLDPDTYKTTTDIVEATFPVADAELMLAALQSDRRAVSMRADFSQMATGDAPPPKAGFWLLDRPLPESIDEMTADELPDSLCEILLYGKETDRDARLMAIIARGDDYDQSRTILKEIGGDQFDDHPDERELGQVAAAGVKLRVQTHFPEDTPAGLRGRMLARRYEHTLLNKWVNIPLDVLDGKTPTEANSDPALRQKLLAAILVLESGQQQHDNLELYDQLREKLGLPTTHAASAFEDVRRTPLMRLSRLDSALMNDEDLLLAFSLAAQNSLWMAIVKLGSEIIQRESLKQRVNLADVYARLAKYTLDRDRAIDFIQDAQQFEIARGESPARWKISELGMRLATGDSTGAQQLLNAIQTHHMNEPGVPQLLVQMLSQFGLIQPDGRPINAPPGPGLGAAPVAGDVMAGGLDPSTAPGGTPSLAVDAPPPEQDESKGKLWLPGMD